jgi:hypothetical protein
VVSERKQKRVLLCDRWSRGSRWHKDKEAKSRDMFVSARGAAEDKVKVLDLPDVNVHKREPQYQSISLASQTSHAYITQILYGDILAK